METLKETPDEWITKILNKYFKDKHNIEITLETPLNNLGDFALPCFQFAKILKKPPQVIAEDIALELIEYFKSSKEIKKIDNNGPYINFFLNYSYFANTFKEKFLSDDFTYLVKEEKKVVLEFPGPNTNKPLHLGHVRNMVLGTALTSLNKTIGNKPITVNINNDRGVHICKSMLAYKKWGKDDSPEKSDLKSDFFVGKYYVLYSQKAKKDPELEKEVQEMLRKWEEGDKETLELWEKMNRWAFEGFKKTYEKFGIKFDKEYYESKTYQKGKDVILKGERASIFKKDESGAIIIDLEEEGLGKKVLLRANGTSVYITQDIALARERFNDWEFDKMIYIVGNEQEYHFKVLFKIFNVLEYPFANKCYHFSYGLINLPSGKMKSREGTIVDADDIIAEVVSLARKETKQRHPKLTNKELDKRAEIIGMTALKFFLLKYDAKKDFTFDPKKSIEFEGETGGYVLYTYARANSILEKAESEKDENKKTYGESKEIFDFKEEIPVIKHLFKYPETLEDAALNMKPHSMCHYLLELCQLFNEFYHKNKVLVEDKATREKRMWLVKVVKKTIKKGLNSLGMETVEKM